MAPAQAVPQPSISPGTVLAGKFRVERVLGVGGMGTVVAATHLQLEELVAIKILLPEVGKSPEAASRFEREARASVKIKSEHVVRVLDVAKLEDGTPYMVMEYLAGTDLNDLVHAQGALPVETAVLYLLEACEAIAAAHALGIVHRDIKPANLFLAQRGDGTSLVKVLDFGISKLSSTVSQRDASLTKTNAVMGSPLYMAPEQMQSAKNADNRTDIWSLGCVLYELSTGRPPFLADTLPELCSKILTEPAPLPSSLVPQIPHSLDPIILRCLEKLPANRYADVGQLAQALLPFCPSASPTVERILRRGSSSIPPEQRPSVPGVGAPPGLAQTDGAWSQRTSSARSPSAVRWTVLGVLLLTALGGVYLAWHLAPRGSSETRVEAGSAPPPLSALSPPENPQPVPSSTETRQPDLVLVAPDAGVVPSVAVSGSSPTRKRTGVSSRPAAIPSPAPVKTPSTATASRRRSLDIGIK